MAGVLSTVADYVTQARILLQDTEGPDYRYPDLDLVNALNFGLTRARQLRADLFLHLDDEVPYFTSNDGSEVDIDIQYRQGLLMYIVGHAQLRDDEETVDERAAAMMNSLVGQLTEAGGG